MKHRGMCAFKSILYTFIYRSNPTKPHKADKWKLTVHFSPFYNQKWYRSLQWLRGPNRNVELELETIRLNVRASTVRSNPFPSLATGNLWTKTSMQTIYTNIKSVLKNVRIIKPVSITCGLMVFQRFTGKI